MFTGILLSYEIKELSRFLNEEILSFSRDKQDFYIMTKTGTIIINTGETSHIRFVEEKIEKERFFSNYLEGKKITEFKQEGFDRVLDIIINGIIIKIFFFGRHSNLIIYENDKIIFSLKEKIEIKKTEGISIESDLVFEEIKKGGNVVGLTKTFINHLRKLKDEDIKEFLKFNFSPCYNENIVSPFHIPNFKKALSVNDAICLFLKEKEEIKEESKTIVNKKIESLKKAIEELSNPTEYEHYRLWGELIMMNLNVKPENPLRLKTYTGEDIFIPIDLSKNLKRNAEEYFKLYKKGKSREEKRLKTIEELKKKIEELKNKGITFKKEEKEERKKFKEFKTSSGLLILVGKSAKNNDELTFKKARKFDYFFHVREAPGAHTILFLKDKNIKPSKKDIEEAAIIAAKNSKARNSSIVPVSYTEVRYLRKVKGKPGAVILNKEKVIFVRL